MCAGGLPTRKSSNPVDAVRAALEMLAFVDEKNKARKPGSELWELRIGINSGPLMAGVIGTKKYAYDIWGNTVNVASRMESASEPGRVNISYDTYEFVKNSFNFQYCGKVAAKSVGEIDMYFIENEIEITA